MKLPKNLEAMRDELAEESFREDGPGYLGMQIYREAFNAASDIYLPVVMELIEILQRYDQTERGGYIFWTMDKKKAIICAKEKLGL